LDAAAPHNEVKRDRKKWDGTEDVLEWTVGTDGVIMETRQNYRSSKTLNGLVTFVDGLLANGFDAAVPKSTDTTKVKSNGA
jgi:hypothetical protein